jgi:predicted porin
MVPDPRESYVKLEGSWGSVLAGRTLGIHDRGGTLIDYYYADGYSIGSPCNATQQGPLCGHIGYGYQFPGYNAGILYSTPLAGGFQVTAGVYDPVRIGLGTVSLTRLQLCASRGRLLTP